ncbi:MAG: hypothetical protein E6Q97_18405 [Desulfurellales bacterium]|nr:MAG: hypothetical protein E6Q97_18405 [Desulfurellales bacterium]
MSELPDFEAMTTDELVAFKRDIKGEIDQLRDKARAANEVYAQRVEQEHIDEATRQVEIAAEQNGISPRQQAFRWLTGGEPDPGHRIHATRFLKASGDPDFADASMNPHREVTA